MKRAAAVALAVAAVAFAPGVHAQLGLGAPGQQQQQAPKPPPGEETHAAPGAEDSKVQTQEPTLPADPLKVPAPIAARIGTDADPDVETGLGTKTERSFYGLWYSERSGNYSFKTLFPLWAERRMPNDRATFVTPFFFNRRSTDFDADVLFPFAWRLRDHEVHTTIVGPWLHRESDGIPGDKKSPARHDNWLAPLYFEGSSADGSGYFHVPPLLTFTSHTSHSGFNLIGPGFCKWKGGATCDPRTADKVNLGVVPFYFYNRDDRSEQEVIPPLLHYYSYTEVGDSSTNLWGPYLRQHDREGDVLNVMPIYWHNWGKNEDHTTLFPLFHYGYKGNSRLLVTPLFLSARGEKGESTFATWGYARYRGRTELDMITPLYWGYRDPDIQLDRKILFPFFYRNTSPRDDDFALFPFYAHFHKPAIRESWWVSPLFRHERSLTGWETDVFPFFYMGRENQSTHLVVAPILWDFASPKSRSTIVLPVYYRFADDSSVSQLALNTYYHEKKVRGGKEWEFHFFPLVSYGQSPTGHWWNLLYGLAGYTREGTATKIRALYVPIPISE